MPRKNRVVFKSLASPLAWIDGLDRSKSSAVSHVLSDYLMTRDPSWLVTYSRGRCEIAAFLLSMNELTGAVSITRSYSSIAEEEYYSF